MNKIKLINNQIEEFDEKNINVSNEENKIVIDIINDLDLEIEYINSNDLDIIYNLKENINVKIFEIRTNSDLKLNVVYNLDDNSSLSLTKFYDLKNVEEVCNINLNKNANLLYKLKTISNGNQNYNLNIYHKDINSISNIYNSGVNMDGVINFNVSGIVPNGIKNCELNQQNQIITFSDNKCIINPKLLIEENDVVANHSALIGKFDDESLFYMKCRGIDYENAITLLVKGFLLENMEDERLNKIIEKYWR